MAKNEHEMIETASQTQEIEVPQEPIFESSAYSSPQRDTGSDVTVLKPVGIGGPVPIVAPKHNTIQLQPIVVPLAVVPYMSQDSTVLRTDGRSPQTPASSSRENTEAADISAVSKDKEETARKKGPRARVFSLISFLLALITVAPFILSYFNIVIAGKVNFAEFDTIRLIEGWVHHTIKFSFTPVTNILGLVIMAMAMLSALLALIGLIIGKYPRPLICILDFIGLGCLVAELVLALVKKTFVIGDRIIFIVMLALFAITFILSVIFSVNLNKLDDSDDDDDDDSEI